MHEPTHRRGALQRIAAGAAAAGASVSALASRADARGGPDAERSGSRSRPHQTIAGDLRDVTYTPLGKTGTDHYRITGVGNGATMKDLRRGRRIRMSDLRLSDYLRRRSDDNLGGHVCFGLQGINWRLYEVSFDQATSTWNLDARVCESNPDARPATTREVGAADLPPGYNGCSCACDKDCYHCGADSKYNGYSWCGFSYAQACL